MRKGFKTRYRHVLQPELWIPGGIDIVFGWVDPTAEKVTIGSVGHLHSQLTDLNARTWRASARKIASWQKTEPRSFEDAARRGFALLHQLASRAASLGLPMRLDS